MSRNQTNNIFPEWFLILSVFISFILYCFILVSLGIYVICFYPIVPLLLLFVKSRIGIESNENLNYKEIFPNALSIKKTLNNFNEFKNLILFLTYGYILSMLYKFKYIHEQFGSFLNCKFEYKRGYNEIDGTVDDYIYYNLDIPKNHAIFYFTLFLFLTAIAIFLFIVHSQLIQLKKKNLRFQEEND